MPLGEKQIKCSWIRCAVEFHRFQVDQRWTSPISELNTIFTFDGTDLHDRARAPAKIARARVIAIARTGVSSAAAPRWEPQVPNAGRVSQLSTTDERNLHSRTR